MCKKTEKPKVMLHYIMPPKTSGPNTSMERLENSWLKQYYYFGQLVQDVKPGKFFNFKLLIKMIKQVKLFRPDIVHVSGLQSAGFYAVLAAKLGGCSNIVTVVHGSSLEAIGFSRVYKSLFRYFIEPVTMKLSRCLYTVCYDMSNKFGIKERDNFAGVIHNPAPMVGNCLDGNQEYRAILGVAENCTLVVCVGRMTYDKGISYVIEAIKKLGNSKIFFLFVGDGPYCDIIKKELGKEIEDKRVFVLGKRNDVLKILATCDVFLFPTLHENLSNALLEACAMGLSVVATSVGGNTEVISNEITGLIIPPHDSEAIVTALNRLHKNKEEIRKFGDAAKMNIEENFSQEVIYEKVNKIYKSILENS